MCNTVSDVWEKWLWARRVFHFNGRYWDKKKYDRKEDNDIIDNNYNDDDNGNNA